MTEWACRLSADCRPLLVAYRIGRGLISGSQNNVSLLLATAGPGVDNDAQEMAGWMKLWAGWVSLPKVLVKGLYDGSAIGRQHNNVACRYAACGC